MITCSLKTRRPSSICSTLSDIQKIAQIIALQLPLTPEHQCIHTDVWRRPCDAVSLAHALSALKGPSMPELDQFLYHDVCPVFLSPLYVKGFSCTREFYPLWSSFMCFSVHCIPDVFDLPIKGNSHFPCCSCDSESQRTVIFCIILVLDLSSFHSRRPHCTHRIVSVRFTTYIRYFIFLLQGIPVHPVFHLHSSPFFSCPNASLTRPRSPDASSTFITVNYRSPVNEFKFAHMSSLTG
jgi:hypothetical protein